MVCLWRDQGKRNEARELLAPVYGRLTEGLDTLDLKEAKALLEERACGLGVESAHSSGRPTFRKPSITINGVGVVSVRSHLIVS
jgi:hypothetical protein